MEKAIRLQVRKDVNGLQQLSIIKLKGSLISQGFTEIIHIEDQDSEFYINFFEVQKENTNKVHDYIADFICKADLSDLVRISR